MTAFRRVLTMLLLVAAPRLAAQDTKLAGFAQMELEGTDRRTDKWSFALDGFDLYLTSRLSNHISFLTEIFFEYRNGDFVSDVERVVVTFTPRTYFRISTGKLHEPIGYWNTAYHAGTLIQPTVDRPLIFTHEDDGGILNLHEIGLSFWGRDISPLHLGYDVMVGNGIGSTPIVDNDNAKAYTLALRSQVTSAFSIGASLYLDRIAAGTLSMAGAPLAEEVKEQVVGGFAVYRRSPWEVVGEWQHVTNSTASGSSHATDGFYVYAGYRLHQLTPYARYEELRYPATDPFYLVDDTKVALAGARYDFAPTATLKFELRHKRSALAGTVTEGAIQVAVGF